MPTAILRNNTLSTESIDAAAGVIRGVRIAEVNKLANFKGADGKAKSFTMSPEHIEALLSHAGNRSLPVHWTHDYLGDEKDNLHAMVGAIKALRKDDAGNLIADLHIAPTDKKDIIMWSAENSPQAMMMSAVFLYGAHDKNCMPLSFDAADLVQTGAVTTALLSKAQPEPDMTEAEIKSLVAIAIADALKSPETRAALSAINPAPTVDTAALAAAETAAGVLPEDKLPTDTALGPQHASSLAIQRATLRKSETATATKVQAAVLGQIGGGGFAIGAGGGSGADSIPAQFESAVTAALSAGAASRGLAKARIARDKPELYAKWSELRDAGLLAKV